MTAAITRGTRTVHELIFRVILLALALAVPLPAQAQDYPNKPIKIVIPYVGGGGISDRLARLVAEKFHARWGQPTIVESRPGASGNIGAEYVAKSAPDGYTLLFAGGEPLVTNKMLFAKLAFDPDAFVPVSLVVTSPNLLAVNPRVPASNVQELIAYAKANPDRLNFASNGAGGNLHLSGEMFNSMAGTRIVHIPYKGVPPAVTDLVGGQVEMMFVGLGTVLQQIRAGKVKVLAIASEKRNPLLPDTPTLTEVLPGFISTTSFGMVAPPKTPSAIANRLSGAIAELLKQPDVVKQMAEQSFERIGSTPAEMAQFLREETERWGKVIRDNNIRGE
jgi:tripartite-type tricarboxylate transporter receptor subunit TctC